MDHEGKTNRNFLSLAPVSKFPKRNQSSENRDRESCFAVQAADLLMQELAPNLTVRNRLVALTSSADESAHKISGRMLAQSR